MINLHFFSRQRFYGASALLTLVFVFIYMVADQQGVQSDSAIRAPVDDAYVASGQPSQIAIRTKFMLVGYDQTLNPRLQDMQMLMRFQLPTELQGQVVEAANLSLYLSPAYTTQGDTPLKVSVQLVTDEWSENDQSPLTWQRRLGFNIPALPITTTLVATAPGWYQWNLRDLVGEWVSQQRGNIIGVILIGDTQGIEHKRSFYTKDCPDTDCGQPGSTADKRPKLELIFAPPTPTVTNTPPPTLTPIPTPTPQPGIASLQIRSEPTGVIASGDALTYTIDYRAIDYPNSSFTLDTVVITNAVPAKVELIPNSIRGLGDTNVLYTYTGVIEGSVITWILKDPVHDGESGRVAYSVRRPPLPTPAANGLSITKQGPAEARAGQIILYQLIATNLTDTLASSVVITDRLPPGATYVLSSDNGSIQNGIVRWERPELGNHQSISVTLAVRANETIVNSDYGVSAAKGLFAQGAPAVKTVIIGTSVLPPVSNTITNNGAWITWQFKASDDPLRDGSLFSGPTYNPLTAIYLPVVAR